MRKKLEREMGGQNAEGGESKRISFVLTSL